MAWWRVPKASEPQATALDASRPSRRCHLLDCPLRDVIASFFASREVGQLACVCSVLQEGLSVDDGLCTRGPEEDKRPRRLYLPYLDLQLIAAEAGLDRVSMPHVRVLKVAHRQDYDSVAAMLCERGPRVLRSLERLCFQSCQFCPNDVVQFFSPLFCVGQLRQLNLERSFVGDDFLCSLLESGTLQAICLESLNLRFNHVGDRGACALASSGCCASLERLNLKMNQVSDVGAAALAKCLHGNEAMIELNLRRQLPGLSDRTASHMANMLCHNGKLQRLRLRRNRITDEGAAALATAVSKHLRLLGESNADAPFHFELGVAENRIEASGALALLNSASGAPPCASVEVLLHGNPIDRDLLTRRCRESECLSLLDSYTDPRVCELCEPQCVMAF